MWSSTTDGWPHAPAGAAYKNHTGMVELLLEASAQVDEVNVAGHTALLVAATMGHRAVVSTLLFWGAAVDCVDPEGQTAQAVAAVQGSTAMAQALLAWGLDEKHCDTWGWSLLHLAARDGHCPCLCLLLESCPALDCCSHKGHTAPALLPCVATTPPRSCCCTTGPTPTCVMLRADPAVPAGAGGAPSAGRAAAGAQGQP